MANPKTRSPRNSRRSLSRRMAEAWRTLACVSAFLSSPRSWKTWPTRASRSLSLRLAATALAHETEDAPPADVERPRPWARQPEGVGVVDGGREEDDLGAPHQVLVGDVAHAVARRLLAAVGGVVAVVAHHEVMAGRHLVGLGIVELAVGDGVQHVVLDAIGQRLLEARDRPVLLRRDEVALAHLGDRLAVDVQHAAAHSDLVARQADDTFDEVRGIVARQLEDRDVAALGLAGEDAALEGDEAQGEGIAAVAVGELR